MRVRILRSGNIVNTIDIKATDKHNTGSEFGILRRIEAMQKTEDVLKTGMLGTAELGINSLRCKEGVWQVSEDNKGVYKLDGIERNLKFDVRMYELGFVLGTGSVGTNILGMSFDAYLSKLGKRKFRCSPKDSAKVFPSLKNLKSFIEKNKDALRYIVKRYGYEWNLEDANPLSAEDYSKALSEMTPKKREKEDALREEIIILLNEINASEDEDRMPEELPTEMTPETLNKEALRRMQLLDMWQNVRRDFESKGSVYMSEIGGIVYDLNDDAKKAVKKVTDDGNLPYAVIRQNTTIGEMYTVLYVSKNTDSWAYEIPTNKGWLTGCVYNKDMDYFEYGSVQIKPVNGGLARVA